MFIPAILLGFLAPLAPLSLILLLFRSGMMLLNEVNMRFRGIPKRKFRIAILIGNGEITAIDDIHADKQVSA